MTLPQPLTPADCDSSEVTALKEQLADALRDYSDWGRNKVKRLRARIRSQRLAEARARGTHTKEEWQAIVEEFDYRCVRCGCLPEGGPCKDHVTPIYLGGSDGVDNLQPVCRECNSSKGPESLNWAQYRRENGFEEIE